MSTYSVCTEKRQHYEHTLALAHVTWSKNIGKVTFAGFAVRIYKTAFIRFKSATTKKLLFSFIWSCIESFMKSHTFQCRQRIQISWRMTPLRFKWTDCAPTIGSFEEEPLATGHAMVTTVKLANDWSIALPAILTSRRRSCIVLPPSGQNMKCIYFKQLSEKILSKVIQHFNFYIYQKPRLKNEL